MEAFTIRPMLPEDPPVIADAFTAQGWNKPREQYERYYAQQQAGQRKVFILLAGEEFAGYVTLLPTPSGGPWKGQNVPEICDFNVLKKFRGRGFGWALMDAAEQAAAETGSVVTLGVGLYTDYGTAQRMYVKRGYLPDGSGIWYGGDQPLPPGAPCVNDDDLILYLSKRL
ncbi:MAG: GNAT family N-acetyltransferase [Oscillospiraceae bacterium]|nr:GNAT family N-acetyltransferase [Oscillospiraceae bacterium]